MRTGFVRKVVGTALLVLAGISAGGATFPPPQAVAPCTLPEGFAMSERDTVRFNDLEASRLRGLAGALLSPDADARAELNSLFAGGFVPTNSIPPGDYQCRSIEMGGLLPLTIYGYFSCEVTASKDGWQLEKTSGSQRLSGVLKPAGDGLAYRGALHYSDEGPRPYDGASERDQVGCMVQTAGEPTRFLLELPDPLFNPEHQIIELVPAE